MISEKMIFPEPDGLSTAASGLLTTMVNIPEADYCTAKELYSKSDIDDPAVIRAALVELLDKGFIIIINGRYAVKNKLSCKCT